MRKSEVSVTIKGGSSVDKADIANYLYAALKEVGFNQVQLVRRKPSPGPLIIVRDKVKIVVE